MFKRHFEGVPSRPKPYWGHINFSISAPLYLKLSERAIWFLRLSGHFEQKCGINKMSAVWKRKGDQYAGIHCE